MEEEWEKKEKFVPSIYLLNYKQTEIKTNKTNIIKKSFSRFSLSIEDYQHTARPAASTRTFIYDQQTNTNENKAINKLDGSDYFLCSSSHYCKDQTTATL